MFSRLITIVILVGFVASSRISPAADWPQWLGPTRNGVTSEVVAPCTTPPEVVWRYPAGNGYSSSIVALYLATLSRLPTTDERALLREFYGDADGKQRAKLLGDVFWVLLNSAEFRWNH